MTRLKIAGILALIVATPAALSLPASADELKYVGSSTVGKFISDAAAAYKSSTFKVDTQPESAGGESCPMRGACDIGGVAREVGSDFIGQGVQATLIGKDAIGVVVNADNPVKALSMAQLKDIFTGKVTNWSQLGGPDLKIKPLIVKQGSATRSVFEAAIMGGAEYAGAEVVTPDAKIIGETARDKGAIGQISFSFLQGASGIRALDIDGQKAAVTNPAYPITRPLYLTTKGAPAGDAKAFIDWAVSPAGQEIVKKSFVVAK
jgi:phosphate transport system substrate-binding protein